MSRMVRSTEKERVYGETRSDAIQGLGRASWRDPQCLNLPQPTLQLIPTRENAAHQPSLALPGEAPAGGQALNHRRRLQVRTSPPRPPIVAEYASPKPVAAGRPSACRARRFGARMEPREARPDERFIHSARSLGRRCMCIRTLYSVLPWSMITQLPSRYVIAGVGHRSSRGCKDLAAPASGRLMLIGIVQLLCIVGIQAAHVDGKGIPIAVVAAVRDPVLPKTALASKAAPCRARAFDIPEGTLDHSVGSLRTSVVWPLRAACQFLRPLWVRHSRCRELRYILLSWHDC
jgi:hypothetical protein